ncbi:MAG: ATP-binding protein [Rhodospirillales bacterium]|nr:ATP-binding protein [Rhodospirillales bacterium]MCW8862278.1 ATP-binding protein [Rhodospirillales bacterium]MCW8952813.1 ATP-binding protein [Rhodospirillales bacterium]MCW9002894.1 ATP-binding protein [Rhodospirillales bacterium]MCW9039940.1 ATP-binding protein [Rhodospirillales bacterium]
MRGAKAIKGGWMTRRYLLALSVIGLLACSAYYAFEMLSAQYENTLSIVNVSGRQRMLTQQTALFAERLVDAGDGPERKYIIGELQAATNLLAETHMGLTRGGRSNGHSHGMSTAIRDLYYGGAYPLDVEMREYITTLRGLMDMPVKELSSDMLELRFISATANGPMLVGLEKIVAQYQAEGEAGFVQIYHLETLVVLLTLLTLTLEAFLIFRPMVRQVRNQIEQIEQIGEELRRARDTLEEQVAQRTLELTEAKEAAEQANLAKSKFLAAAGHDLQTPLEAIGLFTATLGKLADTDKTRAVVNDLRTAQKSMRGLLTSLLEISKLEAGVVEPKQTAIPIATVFRPLINEFRPLAKEKGLELRVVHSNAEVWTDPALLERILRNFLSNAVNYTKKGKILLGCRRQQTHIRIEIHDTGVGVPEEKRHLIFEEFMQLNDPDRDRSQGIGLGLAIVDRLAQLLGHPVDMRSEVGRGSVFAVVVPSCAFRVKVNRSAEGSDGRQERPGSGFQRQAP